MGWSPRSTTMILNASFLPSGAMGLQGRCHERHTERDVLGARLRGRTATQSSKIRVLRRFWQGFWGRVLRRVLRRGSAMGFTVLRRVLRRGSEKGVSRRCLERPFGEDAPLGAP